MFLRASSLLASWLALSCACDRTEEPAAPIAQKAPNGPYAPQTAAIASSRAAGTEAVATSPSNPAGHAGTGGTASEPACIVPLGDPAPAAAKADQCPRDPTGNLTLPKGRVTFVDAPGTPHATVELARDDVSRSRGLMYRTSMPADGGMLFSWNDERVRSFWMRNTCIPLDMFYITKDGVIAGILEQVPTMNDAPRGIRCPVSHVLELNAGYARSHKIAPGMKVRIDG